MSSRVRFFIIIEAALFLMLAYQIISNPATLVFSILAVLSLVWANSLHRGNFLKTPLLLFGTIALVVTVFINPTAWWMIMVAILAILFAGRGSISSSGLMPWFRKQFVSVRTTGDGDKGTDGRRPWFGDFVIGQSVFEWEDVNISILTGDTIVDLGNTILPRRDNVVMIRKGFGKTRVLVPIGVGIELNHSALVGKVDFGGAQHILRNETLHLYSDDYESAPRHLRIVTSAIIGDLEVVPV
ncbi:cell wall-active antibiotics response protein LiaF [Lacticaseibacillus zhaodongensis]|uniref:cell wall-active antibiotics response protein LiaF n=1 Tax=Lacticaseibacillus zhaodongensis TaxID=2668065 RepID=UPI0018AFC6D5|nr:cell wall-active antibiotics response protein LiaF [Lacticaseibacillus zhaodongensis]